jgi:lipid A 4'-phosphatase
MSRTQTIAIVLTAAFIGLAALFLAFPEIDFAAARLFYAAGRGFIHKDDLPVVALYQTINVLEKVVIVGVLGLAMIRLIPPLRRFHLRWAVIAYLVLSFGIGPGLVTNGLLKNEMGRARPSQVTEFGGKARFTPALVPSDQCQRNCSFVSGHAAFAFSFITLALLATPGRRRKWAIAGVMAFGVLAGLGRMAQGGHWLSDVLFAAVINIAIAWALYRWVVVGDGLARLFERRT